MERPSSWLIQRPEPYKGYGFACRQVELPSSIEGQQA